MNTEALRRVAELKKFFVELGEPAGEIRKSKIEIVQRREFARLVDLPAVIDFAHGTARLFVERAQGLPHFLERPRGAEQFGFQKGTSERVARVTRFLQDGIGLLGHAGDFGEKLFQFSRDRRRCAWCVFYFKEMLQATLRIAQDLIGLVELRERALVRPAGVRMSLQALAVENFLQRFRIEPGPARLFEKREVIGHAEKLSPQEQCATAFGLVTLKPPFCRSSL